MTDADAAAGGGLLVAGMLVVAGLVLLVSYFVPTVIAMLRRHNVGGVFLVNLLLGWTFLGWGRRAGHGLLVEAAADAGLCPAGARLAAAGAAADALAAAGPAAALSRLQNALIAWTPCGLRPGM